MKQAIYSFVLLLMLSKGICAQSGEGIPTEKKVDYLERIYFSGENKAGLKGLILVAIQEIEKQPFTQDLSKQRYFLGELNAKAESVENACDLLEMLAVGIYNIDAAEANAQNIKMPSDNAKAKTGNVIDKLNSISKCFFFHFHKFKSSINCCIKAFCFYRF